MRRSMGPRFLRKAGFAVKNSTAAFVFFVFAMWPTGPLAGTTSGPAKSENHEEMRALLSQGLNRHPSTSMPCEMANPIASAICNQDGVSGRASSDGLTVWATASTHKVGPSAPPEVSNLIFSSNRGLVHLDAARGENEAFHLILTAGENPLNNLEVVVSDLVGANDIIESDHIGLFRQSFFPITTLGQTWEHPSLGTLGEKPDALIPFVDPYGSGIEVGVPFTIAATANQPIWVSIDVPKGLEGSFFEGSLTVLQRGSGAVLATITLQLEVWDFEIPEKSNIETYYNIDAGTVAHFHDDPDDINTLMENYYRALSRRRLAAGYWFYSVPSYNEVSGFHWHSGSDVGEQWSEWLDHQNMSTFGVVPIFDADAEAYRITQADGTAFTTADLSPGSLFVERARRFFDRQWHDLQARGWLDKAVVYLEDDLGALSDEPYTEGATAYNRLRTWAEILHHPHDTDPNVSMRLLVAGDSIIPTAPFADLRGASDVWDMYIDEIDHNADQYQSRFVDFPEEELWVVPNTYGDSIDYPAIYHRAIGWFVYKYGASGIEQWDMLAWFDENENLVDPWIPNNLTPVWGWGAGGLFWPGSNVENRGVNIKGPISSLRLELQRQSFEDYEYLHLLEIGGFGDFAKGLATGCLPGALHLGLDIDSDQYERARNAAGMVLDGSHAATSHLEGTVSDANLVPIKGALVSNGTSAAISDENGNFRLTVLAADHTVNATAQDFIPQTVNLSCKEGEVIQLAFRLPHHEADVNHLFGSFEDQTDLWSDPSGATVDRSTDHVSHGNFSMHVHFDENQEDPGISAEEFQPSDWSNFNFFEFDVYSGSQYLTELEFELADETWSYYGEIFLVRPFEWTHLRLPVTNLAKVVNVQHVTAIEIYSGSSGKGDRDLWFDNFRLTRIIGPDSSAPGPPRNLFATWTILGVSLQWQAPSQDRDGSALSGLQKYEVFSATTDAGPWSLVNANQEVVATTYLDREAVAGMPQHYQVRAVDQADNRGPVSFPAEATSNNLEPRRGNRRVRP